MTERLQAVDGQEQLRLEQLVKIMYSEISERAADPALNWVIKDKITALFGPPMVRPKLVLITFQGGGGDRSSTEFTWPNRLLYLSDDYPFGRRLRKEFKSIGLYDVLENSTVAIAACFAEAKAREARLWLSKSNPWSDWKRFSVSWLRRLIAAMQPRVVLVFGKKACEALGIDEQWQDEQFDERGWRVFARTNISGNPAVFCQHLSQGATTIGVRASLSEVRELLQRKT